MCSVTKQRSKQRRDVDELSTDSARRRLNRGVATGCRRTVEAATGQTRRHGRRSRDVSDRWVATACWQWRSQQRLEMTPRRCIVAERQRRGLCDDDEDDDDDDDADVVAVEWRKVRTSRQTLLHAAASTSHWWRSLEARGTRSRTR